ncbi:hypothetical protein CIW49_12910 [Mycolicibacterium sp. P1-18]|uniref:hypothetical protein n=1 Tax=Mycolicibacterium sp. P1-18 TaxID=2024615 RepID=UPI0011F1C444|nr:hypothetical protein [Mycolicibacterium sp. P1-18]KAA0098794.1 hypothetical protein CIW49_12910 [Mycolicibacterium sp. P1-18]
MAVWLLVYGAGVVPAIAVMALIALMRRDTHQMPSGAMAKLTVSAGLVWPLLAIAGVQVAGLLVLKTALGLVRAGGDKSEPTADTHAAPMPQPLAVAA